VKLEIDMRPPEGAKSDTKLVNKYFLISFRSYDLPSLFAGKMHALLNRKYTKGRDYYDLVWYLTKWKTLEPNFNLLTNALKQTGWDQAMPNKATWKNLLRQRVNKAQWNAVMDDMLPFLSHPDESRVLTKQNVLNLLK